MTKEQLIEKEIKRLKNLYPDMSPQMIGRADALIRNIAFMSVTLDGLQEAINGQTIISGGGAVGVYNSMVKNLGNAIKQLNEMAGMKPDAKSGKDEKPDAFKAIRGGKV